MLPKVTLNRGSVGTEPIEPGGQSMHLSAKRCKWQASTSARPRNREAGSDQLIKQKVAKKAKEMQMLCVLGDLL